MALRIAHDVWTAACKPDATGSVDDPKFSIEFVIESVVRLQALPSRGIVSEIQRKMHRTLQLLNLPVAPT
jgi:hypothetical protein